MPTYGDLLFGNIAVLNKVLPEDVVVDCYQNLTADVSLQQYVVREGILTQEAADRIDYAKRYYQFKDAERVYYKLVLKNGLVSKDILQQTLKEQKADDNRPPLYSLLLKKRCLTPLQHRDLKGEQGKILNRHAARFVRNYVKKHPSIPIDLSLYQDEKPKAPSSSGLPTEARTGPPSRRVPRPSGRVPPSSGRVPQVPPRPSGRLQPDFHEAKAPPSKAEFPSTRTPLPQIPRATGRREPPPPASSAEYVGVSPANLPNVPPAPAFANDSGFARPDPGTPGLPPAAAGLPVIPPSKAFDPQPSYNQNQDLPAVPPAGSFSQNWGPSPVGGGLAQPEPAPTQGFQPQAFDNAPPFEAAVGGGSGFQNPAFQDYHEDEETRAPPGWNSDFTPPPPASTWGPEESPLPHKAFGPPVGSAPGFDPQAGWGNSPHQPPGAPVGGTMVLPSPMDSGIGHPIAPPEPVAAAAAFPPPNPGGGDPWIGQKIGAHYRIIEKIGEGGMGSVYKAKHELMSREVAIKLINPELITNEETLQRFQREIRAMSSFQNKHTVEIYDAGELPDGSCFMAMEFLDGETLTALMERGPVPLKKTTELALQILNAVNAAHEKKIVHRDLKPDNIMITNGKDGKDFIKIMDFGVAKILEEPADTHGDGSPIFVSMAGTVTGTPQYMSPEQASGDPVDHRSDLYSIGVILYEMLSGVLPFESQSPVGFLGQHISQPPPPFKVRVPDSNIPPPFEEIVMRLLTKVVSQRYQSGSEVIEDLKTKVVPIYKKPQKKTFFSRFFGRG